VNYDRNRPSGGAAHIREIKRFCIFSFCFFIFFFGFSETHQIKPELSKSAVRRKDVFFDDLDDKNFHFRLQHQKILLSQKELD
jgi:hypothetical protein